MATILVMYHTPTDPKSFDEYYYGTHADIAKKIPGLQRLNLSCSQVNDFDGSASPYHLIATLEFASMNDLQAATTTPELQAAAADLANFATGGVTIYAFDTKDA